MNNTCQTCGNLNVITCGTCSVVEAGPYSNWRPSIGQPAAPKCEASTEGPAPDKSAFTRQVGGHHYTDMRIQPFEFSMANGLDAMQHTVIKYVARFRSKGGIPDLEKAIHTIQLLIEWEQKHKQSSNQERSA